MMRKKVVFTRNPACAPFFPQGYSQNLIFKKYNSKGQPPVIWYMKQKDHNESLTYLLVRTEI